MKKNISLVLFLCIVSLFAGCKKANAQEIEEFSVSNVVENYTTATFEEDGLHAIKEYNSNNKYDSSISLSQVFDISGDNKFTATIAVPVYDNETRNLLDNRLDGQGNAVDFFITNMTSGQNYGKQVRLRWFIEGNTAQGKTDTYVQICSLNDGVWKEANVGWVKGAAVTGTADYSNLYFEFSAKDYFGLLCWDSSISNFSVQKVTDVAAETKALLDEAFEGAKLISVSVARQELAEGKNHEIIVREINGVKMIKSLSDNSDDYFSNHTNSWFAEDGIHATKNYNPLDQWDSSINLGSFDITSSDFSAKIAVPLYEAETRTLREDISDTGNVEICFKNETPNGNNAEFQLKIYLDKSRVTGEWSSWVGLCHYYGPSGWTQINIGWISGVAVDAYASDFYVGFGQDGLKLYQSWNSSNLVYVHNLSGLENSADYNAFMSEYFQNVTQISVSVKRDGGLAEGKHNEVVIKELNGVNKQGISVDEYKVSEQYNAMLINQVSIFKEKALSEIKGYKSEDNYYDTEKGVLQEKVNTAVANLNNATSLVVIDELLAGAKTEIDAIKNKATVDAEELAKYKNSELQKLQNLLDLTQYRDAQKSEINSILENASNQIETCESKAAIDELCSQVKQLLMAVKPASKLLEEELALAKEEMLASIDTYVSSIDLTKYTAENQEVITGLVNDCKALVVDTTELSVVEGALDNLKNSVAAVEVIKEPTDNPGKEPGDGEQNIFDNPILNGCTGSIVSSLIGVIALASIAFFVRKKEE